MKKNKDFDSIETVRKIRDTYHDQLANKGWKEQKKVFKSEAENLKKKIEKQIES